MSSSTVNTFKVEAVLNTTKNFSNVIAQGMPGSNGTNGILIGETMVFVSGFTWTIAHPALGFVQIIDNGTTLLPVIDYTQIGQSFTFLRQNPVYPFAIYPR